MEDLHRIIIPDDNKFLETVLKDLIDDLGFDVNISTGTSAQTWDSYDTDKIIQNAVNSVQCLHDEADGTVAIALREGIHYHIYDVEEGKTQAQFTLQMWVAANDGSEVYFASGPAFPIPYQVGRDVAESGGTIDSYLSKVINSDISPGQGFTGKLTQDKLTRTESLKHALIGALSPLLNRFKKNV